MEGIFCNKRWNLISNILGLIAGIFLPALFGSLLIGGALTEPADTAAAWFFSVFGMLVALLCGVSLYVNKKAFIRADEEEVSGYFHFGLALHCRIADIEAISYGGTGLNLQLKNGKKYNMHNLENAYAIGNYIKRQMPLPPLTALSKEKLLQAVHEARRKRKNCGLSLIGCFVLIFAGIFLTVWLTGGKEMRDFVSGDWRIFGVMVGMAMLLGIAIGLLVRRFVRYSELFQKRQDELHLLVLRTAPLPPGNVLKIYIDADTWPPVRITVCGFPNSDEVYFIAEQIHEDDQLETVQQSQLYRSLDSIMPRLEKLREISMTE